MYKTCPRCRHQRDEPIGAPIDRCPNCGLIYQKWLQNRYRVAGTRDDEMDGYFSRLRATVLYVPDRTEPATLAFRVVLFAVFAVWGWWFILMPMENGMIGNSPMHRVNLVFHEAGHVLLSPFGWFAGILGGSIGQLLMPLVVMIALCWRNQDNFGASLGLWWLSQSLMDLAPYIADARSRQLVLLGGGTGRDQPGAHDWYNILSNLGWLDHDHAIAYAVDMTGQVLMLLFMAWGGYILYQQYRRR